MNKDRPVSLIVDLPSPTPRVSPACGTHARVGLLTSSCGASFGTRGNRSLVCHALVCT